MSENTLATVPEPSKKSPVPAGDRGLHFNNLAEMWRFCEGVVNSHQFKGIDTPEVCLVMLQAGLELGLTPIWSITNIMVVNGRPAVWGDALLGLVLAHPDCVDVVETMNAEGTEATCTVTRRNRLPITRTFSIEDAKQAGLLNKDGPWRNYRKRMMQMRARAWACRDSFADVLRGLGVREEMNDVPEKVATAREITPRSEPVLPDQVETVNAEVTVVEKTAANSGSVEKGDNQPNKKAARKSQPRKSKKSMETKQPAENVAAPISKETDVTDANGKFKHNLGETQTPTQNAEPRNEKGEFEWN